MTAVMLVRLLSPSYVHAVVWFDESVGVDLAPPVRQNAP
jgi:hypothetical protein